MSEQLANKHQIEHGKHWAYIYKKRRRRALTVNVKQMAGSQVISIIGTVIAGAILDSNKGILAAIVGAFVVLPGVIDLDDTLGAAMSAKINHRLEDPANSPLPVFARSLFFALLYASLSGLIVAVVGASVASWFFAASFWQVFWLAEIAMFLSALFSFPLIGVISLAVRAAGANPDDVVGPIESSISNIVTIAIMTITIRWLL